MKNLFVPYELAKQLKEKGFIPTKCGAYQTQENNRLIDFLYNKRDFEIAPHLIPAPLYQQVVDWFEEKHSKFIYAFRYNGIWQNKIDAEHGTDFFSTGKGFASKYEALNSAIKKALTFI